jgi:uncharacterized protein YegL
VKYIQGSRSIQAASGREALAAKTPVIGFVLDRSGSMQSLQDTALAGFNKLLDEQRATNPDARLSLSLFNDRVQLLRDAVPLSAVPHLTPATYEPHGGTGLNDAIGAMITSIGKQAERGTQVLIGILTDGQDTSSRHFRVEDIKQMVTYRQANYSWRFLFVGPDPDYGRRIGITAESCVRFDTNAEELKLLFDRVSKSARAYLLGDKTYALKLQN